MCPNKTVLFVVTNYLKSWKIIGTTVFAHCSFDIDIDILITYSN